MATFLNRRRFLQIGRRGDHLAVGPRAAGRIRAGPLRRAGVWVTTAGIAAAISAARAGAFVLLVEPSTHFGGIVTGGMSNTDFKTFEAVHGLYETS